MDYGTYARESGGVLCPVICGRLSDSSFLRLTTTPTPDLARQICMIRLPMTTATSR